MQLLGSSFIEPNVDFRFPITFYKDLHTCKPVSGFIKLYFRTGSAMLIFSSFMEIIIINVYSNGNSAKNVVLTTRVND